MGGLGLFVEDAGVAADELLETALARLLCAAALRLRVCPFASCNEHVATMYHSEQASSNLFVISLPMVYHWPGESGEVTASLQQIE